MTATEKPKVQSGEYFSVNLDDDWCVLFSPDDFPHQFLRIAIFPDEARARDYAEFENEFASGNENGDARFDAERIKKAARPRPSAITQLRDMLERLNARIENAPRFFEPPIEHQSGAPEVPDTALTDGAEREAAVVPAPVASPPSPEPVAVTQIAAPEGEAAVTPVPAASHPLPEPKRGPPVTKAPGNEKAVLAALKAMAATSDGLVKASYSDIGAKSGVATGSVHPAVAQLIKAGKVEITIRGEHGEKNVYRVLTEPDDAKIDQALDRAIADEKQSVQTRRTTIPPSVIPKPEERAPQRNPLLTEPLADWDSLKSPDGLTEMRGSYLIMNGKPRLLMKDEIPVMRALLSKFGQTVTHNELRMMAKKPTDTIIMLRIYLKGLPVEIEIRGDGFALVATQSAIAAQ